MRNGAIKTRATNARLCELRFSALRFLPKSIRLIQTRSYVRFESNRWRRITLFEWSPLWKQSVKTLWKKKPFIWKGFELCTRAFEWNVQKMALDRPTNENCWRKRPHSGEKLNSELEIVFFGLNPLVFLCEKEINRHETNISLLDIEWNGLRKF